MDLRDYLRGLRRHWLAILLMTIVGVALSYGWTLIQSPVYEASSSGYVASRDAPDVGTSIAGDSLARSKVQSYLDVAGWQIVAEAAIEELGLDTTPEQLVGQVSVTNPDDTVILKVAAQGSTAESARALAEAWIRAMALAIDQVEGTGPGTSPVTIISGDAAALPSSPIFPDVQSALIVGGLIGFGFGAAFALARTASDRRVRGQDEVEEKTGIPVVGAIPLTAGWSDDRRLISDLDNQGKGRTFAVSEAMRSLRTNLQFMDVDHPPRTIVVTSPLPGDGKSTIACNLALTLAAGGKPVVLIDGDLRRPMVAKTLGLPGGAGLTDALAGRAELSEVLQRTPRSPSLFVLAAGSVPPNPSELLGSDRMRLLLADLASHATVIVDAPPLLPVTDGAVLAHQADGALLVISLGGTTYDVVDKAIDTLNKASAKTLGIVLNKVPVKGVDASAYSYEYRREYGDATEAGAGPTRRSEPEAPFNVEAIFTSPPPRSAPPAEAASSRPRARRS